MNVRPNRETGATIIVVAISLLMLLGMVALAIDGGLGYDDRRGTLNAADNAALAAAWESCNPSGVGPEAAALATAAANGYDNTDPNITVTPVDLGDGQWQVRITVLRSGTFGQATPYAGDSLTVVSEAVALCDPTEFLGGMAIFAGAASCQVTELDMSGSSITVNGGIHSNGDLRINAPAGNLILSGPVTYQGNGNQGSHEPGPAREYPIDIDISEYRPGGSRATGPNYVSHNGRITNSWLVSNGYAEWVGSGMGSGIRMLRSGIFYTSSTANNGAIELQSVDGNGHRVTFVAEGEIDIRGSNTDLIGYDPIVPGGNVGMLFFSNYDGTPNCNPSLDAVRFSANASLVSSAGVIFAPNGHVQLSNATIELDGSIIAFMVKSSGASVNVTYQDDPAFVPEYRVELLR